VRREEQNGTGNCKRISLLCTAYKRRKKKRRKRIFRKGYGTRIWMKGKERRIWKTKVKAKRRKGI